MRGFHTVFLVFLSCLPTFAGEGFHRGSQRSILELARTISDFHRLQPDERGRLELILERVLRSTFSLRCPHFRGTGFFVGPTGEFVTAGHVMKEGGKCVLVSQELKGDSLRPARRDVEVRVEETAFTSHYKDFTVGRIRGGATPAYLDLANRTPASYERLLVAGYPIATSRQSIFNRRAYLARYDSACQPWNQYLEAYYKQHPNGTEYHETVTMMANLCELAAYNRAEEAILSYDELPAGEVGNVPLITLGSVQWQDFFRLLSDNDALFGHSGSPMVSLETGEVLALVHGISPGAADPKNNAHPVPQQYAGATVGQLLWPRPWQNDCGFRSAVALDGRAGADQVPVAVNFVNP